jgi:hypothetical protein
MRYIFMMRCGKPLIYNHATCRLSNLTRYCVDESISFLAKNVTIGRVFFVADMGLWTTYALLVVHYSTRHFASA